MTHPFPLFEPIWSPSREVLVTPEITSALDAGAAVAIGVSGGKDSAVTALATIDYLEDLGHRGPRVLIHSDLGRVEWRQSLPACHRLADRLGLELIVVRRETGDLLDRWRSRWENNVRRYAELSCVKLILPWSTASMKFCTSELKTSINHSRNSPALLGAPRGWTGTPFSTGPHTTCSGTSKRRTLRFTRRTRFMGLRGFRVVSAS